VDVGGGGWDQFQFLFAGVNASGWPRIYAVNDEGQLLSYTDNGTPGNVSDPVVAGFGGWGQFQFLFAGRNALGEYHIYAVNEEGQLLSYTDNGTPGNVGPASVTVGGDGWGQFQFLFANWNAFGDPYRIYAVNEEGQLLSYTDNGTPGNVSDPVVVGFGAWLEFKFLFAGSNTSGQDVIYAVTKPPPPPPPPLPPPASLMVGVGPLPQNLGNSGLRIEGNNFGANETVEVTVDWQVSGEGSEPFPLVTQANLAGYFQVWFSGSSPDGLCPITVADGQPQPPQYFSVSATGTTSHKTASASAGPFICPFS
jgi:hypothetical protein